MSRTARVLVGAVASVMTAAPLAWLVSQVGHSAPQQAVPAVAQTAEPTPSAAGEWPQHQPTVGPKPSMPVGTVAAAPPSLPPGVIPPEVDPPAPQPKTDPAPTRAPAPPTRVPPAPRPAPASCVSTGGSLRPTRFQVLRTGVDVPMVTVGKDARGNPGVAKSLYAAAWYTGSPAPGTTRGNVIVNIHANMKGRALGNDLHQGGLRPGDVIRVAGADGKVACYRFRQKVKIRVADYDPQSKVYHDDHGRPQLAIMTCWDRNSRGVYESRIIFYADRIA